MHKLIRKRISVLSLSLSAMVYFVLAIAMFTYKKDASSLLMHLVFISGLVMTLIELLSLVSKFNISRLIKSFMPLGFAMIVIIFQNNFISLYAFFMGFYSLILALVTFIDYLLLRKNKIKGRIFKLYKAIIFMIIALPLFFNYHLYFNRALFFTAIFCLVYSISKLIDAYNELRPNTYVQLSMALN